MRRPGDRAVFWTFAVAAFAAAAAGLAARGIDRMTEDYEAQRQNYAIARVLAPEGPEGVAAAQTALIGAPHVASAAPMNAARAAALLEEWGGAPIAEIDMPPLRLIEIELTPAPANADVAGDLVAALERGGIAAEVVLAPASAGAGGFASRIKLGAFWAAAAFALVMALIVALSARGLAARRSDLVQVLADLGATRGQAAGRVADEAALSGWWAGVTGAALAALAAAGLLYALTPGATVDSLAAMIVPIDAAPLLAAPMFAAVAAAMGARAGAESLYAQAARLA